MPHTLRTLSRRWLPAMLALVAAACAEDTDPTSPEGDAGSVDAAATDAAPAPDAEVAVFPCEGGTCVVATQYCGRSSGGAGMEPDLQPVEPDLPPCEALPEACVADRTCECMVANGFDEQSSACTVGDEGGLTVTIFYP
jgi:hypothetical protein